jgi:RimJ/RimL family protein N-acetyltransferase
VGVREVNLVDVYSEPEAPALLYQLLKERDSSVNVNCAGVPAWSDHLGFIASRPYPHWYLIREAGWFVGATYLTKHDEIGIFILKEFQGRGYGKRAVQLLTQIHERPRYLANINPANSRSRAMFEGMGFGLLQVTYARKEPV